MNITLVRKRLLDRVEMDPATGCWEWQLGRDRDGYGQVRIEAQGYIAHRAAYMAWVGAIPAGMTIDHLCFNAGCINPAHLEAVTNAENIQRAAARRTRCHLGHEFTPENTYFRHDRPGRLCRACGADRARQYRLRRGA